MRFPAPILLLTALLTFGCADDPDDWSESSQAAQVEQFRDARAVALCDLASRCNLGFVPSDADTCYTFLAKISEFEAPDSALAANRLTFDPTAANTCTSFLDGLSCTDAWQAFSDRGTELCQRPFRGTGQTGDLCAGERECADGFRCSISSSQACGTCKIVPLRDCTIDGQPEMHCMGDTYCDASAGRCEPLRQHMEPCDGEGSDWQCVGDLMCVDGMCETSGEVGQSCAGSRRCLDGLYCDVSSVCAAPRLAIPLGQQCDTLTRFCEAETYCAPSGLCEALAGLGADCSTIPCRIEHVCEEGVCKALAKTGEACTTDTNCMSMHCQGGACATKPDGCVDDSSLRTTEQPNIYQTPEWDFLTEFQSDPVYKTGVVLGFATAHVGTTGDRGTGFLIDDEYLVTAYHVWDNANRPNTVNTIFGKFGAGAYYALFTEATDLARRRLRERHGFSSSAAAAVSQDVLTKWDCNFLSHSSSSTYGNRDVAYFVCPAKTLWNGTSWVQVLPGHIWGHIHTEPGTVWNGLSLYGLHVNQLEPTGHFVNILSPGGQVYDHQDYYGSSGWYGLETLAVDSVKGSSGGALLTEYNHRAIGVMSAQYGNVSNWFEHPVSSAYTNFTSYFGSRVQTEFAETPPTIEYSPNWPTWFDGTPVTTSTGSWVGGTGGVLRSYTCPPYFMAAGIIGTEGYAGYVGNLGLVCVPWQHSAPRQQDRGVVLAPGSWDTNYAGSNGLDYTRYISEVLSSTSGVQGTSLCPEKHYLRGLNGYVSGNVIGQITQTNCINSTGLVYDYGEVISPWFGTKTGSYFIRNCPTGYAVVGFNIRSGWIVDGFELECHEFI